MKNNEDIKGICVGDKEFVISYYADDTSLILDRTLKSLETSLRTLSAFAKISGLNMNIDKTQVIWIGKKKFSQETMCVKWGLAWGSSKFNLLGINFSVNLEEMEDLNYKVRLKEIESLFKKWSFQVLSPVGKISVIKSLIISKLNHLFIALPTPNDKILKDFINKIFSFIWDNKPDKINRDILYLPYSLGGLKMTNLEIYIQGLKLTWIRRIIMGNSKISILLSNSENINLDLLPYLGPGKKLKNPFWQEIFNTWSILQEKQNLSKPVDPATISIWNNNNIKIDNQMVNYKSWIEKGVLSVNDLIDSSGKFMTYELFKEKFKVQSNFLQYQGIISAIKSHLRCKNIDIDKVKKINGPLIPNYIQPFIKSKKGSKDMYNILMLKTVAKKCETKWSEILEKELIWKNIHSLPFQITKNSKFQWFQYRIIHRIIGTNELLCKMNIKSNDKCVFCQEHRETIEHLFWSCAKISDIWQELNLWIFSCTEIELPLNLEIVLFGYKERTDKNLVRNLIIIISKFFIYRCKLNENLPNLVALKNYVKHYLMLEKTVYFQNSNIEKAQICWNPWAQIFN